jgi:hypothetical protein
MLLFALWNFMQWRFIICYGRFVDKLSFTFSSDKQSWTFKMRAIGSPETSVTKHRPTPRNISEDWISEPRHDGSLKYCLV